MWSAGFGKGGVVYLAERIIGTGVYLERAHVIR